jgi:hypothetical protein
MKQTQADHRWFRTACFAAAIITSLCSQTGAQPAEVKIVGIGAASRAEF